MPAPPELPHPRDAGLGGCPTSVVALWSPLPFIRLGFDDATKMGSGLLQEMNGSLFTHPLTPGCTGAESLPGNYIQEHKQVIEKPCWQKHQDLISACE